MTRTRGFSLTDAERQRVEHIDRLVATGASSVGELIEMISDASWTVRRAAVGALASLGDDASGPLCSWLRDTRTNEHAIAAAVDALSASIGDATSGAVSALLSNADPAIVADAAVILGRRRATDAAPHLAALLRHEDDNVAVAAIEALGAIGGSVAVDALIEVVRLRNFFRTFPALQVLARTSDPRVVAPIAELIGDDSFQFEAVRALGRTGAALAIAPIASLLVGPGDTTTRLVATALADLLARAEWSGAAKSVADAMRTVVEPQRDRFVHAIEGAEADERIACTQILGAIGGSGTLEVLVRLLEDPATAAAAIESIKRISILHADSLVDAIQRGDAATRIALLPIVRTARAAPVVRSLLVDDEPEVRARACDALARIGDVAAVPALFAALADPNPRVAHAATGAIHSLGSTETPVLATAALKSGTPNIRRHVLRIFAYLGCPESFDVLRAAVEDPDLRIAELAVAAIGVLEGSHVDTLLSELARRPQDTIRASAMRVAAHRGGESMGDLLVRGLVDESSWVRYYACQGLGRLERSASTTALIARLADAYPHVRIAAIEALARLDTPQAWQALTSAARSVDPDEQRAALVGIGHGVRPAAVPFLLEAARAPELATRLIALSGLARTQDPRALEELRYAATGDAVELADAALSLLSERDDRAAAEVLVDLAVQAAPEHPAHLALSRPGAERVTAIAARLTGAADLEATVLAAALARMAEPAATAALFTTLTASSAAGRRAAATVLVAIGADGARVAVSRLGKEDPDPDVRRAALAAVEAAP